MPRQFQGTEYIQNTQPDLLFKDVSLYTETIHDAIQAPHVIREAIAQAYAGRGVAHLTLPQDVLMTATSEEIKSIDSLRPREDFSPNENDITHALKLINEAERIVIMCGAGCKGMASELRALSNKLCAPLIHSVKGKDIMPYDDPCWMGGLGMIGTKPVYHAVMHCDLFIMIGTDYPYSEFLPTQCKVIQIDERARILGRRLPLTLGILGSAKPTINALLQLTATKSNRSFFESVAKERKKWDEMLDKQANLARSKNVIHPQALARWVGDLADDNAVFVLDTGLNTLWSGNWLRQRGTQRIIGSFNNAAVGTALGQANGIQTQDHTRQVIALTGDGGFNMLMGEFMTAVQHQLPIKVVVYNNSSFGLIRLEAESQGIPAYAPGIDFPNPDLAAFAMACGAKGFNVKEPSELESAIREALATPGPAIINAIVAANEVPNLPHLSFKTLENVGIAKIKEAINLVTGS
jgi:thiamine pyrophosphate-dependent acetolactate synthase large subunit-like protein